MSEPLLSIRGLAVAFGAARVVDDLSLDIAPGEKFALVGESGSGKSITALSVLRLVDAATTTGSIRFAGRELMQAGEREMRALRGREVAMIFQEPMTALNPLYTVGNQIGEMLELHEGLAPAQARARAIELLARTGLPEPEIRVDVYPHQLSGGQRQRAMIAMALACRPKLLIADEPTTALDVTIQAQILALIAELVAEGGMALLLISHDLGVIARQVRRMLVMYGGSVVESGPTQEVFARLAHPYTRGLFAARPRLGAAKGTRLATIPGRVPELADLPRGCPFGTRCAFVADACRAALPPLLPVGPGHAARCIRLDAVAAAARATEPAP